MREEVGISLFDMCKIERERKIMTDTEIGDELRLLLIKLCVTPRLRGYDYLLFAIKTAVADPDCVKSVTTKLYPVVAKRFGVDPSIVERNIRHAIGICALRGRLPILNEYLGADVFSENDRPTNAEFISLIADKVAADIFRKSVRCAQR